MSQGFSRISSRCAGTLHPKPSTAPEMRQRSESPHGTGQCVTPERDEKMFPMTNRGDVFMKAKEVESCPLPDRPVPYPGVVSSEESDVCARVRRTPEVGEATGVARTPPARRRRAGPGAGAATGRDAYCLREIGGRARRRAGSGKAGPTPGIMEDVMRCRTRVRRRVRRRRKHPEILETL